MQNDIDGVKDAWIIEYSQAGYGNGDERVCHFYNIDDHDFIYEQNDTTSQTDYGGMKMALKTTTTPTAKNPAIR